MCSLEKNASRPKSKTEYRRRQKTTRSQPNKRNRKTRKQRAEAIRLSSHGWKVAQIAAYFEWHEQTVREIIQRWKRDGEKGVYDLPKTDRPKQWQEEALKYLETCLGKDGQVYNSKQLAVKLEQERQVKLSSDRIRKLLKKKGWVWKRARISHQDKQNQETKAIKQWVHWLGYWQLDIRLKKF